MSDDDKWVRVAGTASAPPPSPPSPPLAPTAQTNYAPLGLGLAVFSLIVPCLPVVLILVID